MTLTQKLVLYALAVALLPLAATGFSLLRVGESALRERIAAHQETAATAIAAKVAQSVDDLGERLSTALELVEPLELSAAERDGLLRLLARQSPAVDVALLVGRDGKVVGDPLVAGDETDVLAGAKRLETNLPSLDAFTRGAAAVLVSPAYYPASGPARVAMAVACCRQDGAPRGLAALELSLRGDVLKATGVDTGVDSRIFLVDAYGRVIGHPSAAVGETLASHGAVSAFLASRAAGHARYRDATGAWAAAFAPVGKLGWAVVVEQPEATAFAPAAEMRRRILFWVGVTTALVLASGLTFAAVLRRRLRRLVDGARAFGAGRLEERVADAAPDEIGALAGTMNGMAAELLRTLNELEEWNRTLEAKVEERTRELKDAQAQLLMQSKLAAIGQLGAGVAHEVNNPLAGILGYTQLLLRKHAADEDAASLKKIEEAAQRCRAITMSLLRFSQRGLSGRTQLDPNKVVDEVVELFQGGLTEAGLTIEKQLGSVPEITADGGQLALVLLNLFSNAKNATQKGGRVSIATAPKDEGVTITVTDTGIGIAAEHLPRIFDPFFTTKKVWTGVGLGLSVAYRIVADHGGRIEATSKLGEGSTFTVFLPRRPPVEPEEPLPGKRAVLLA